MVTCAAFLLTTTGTPSRDFLSSFPILELLTDCDRNLQFYLIGFCLVVVPTAMVVQVVVGLAFIVVVFVFVSFVFILLLLLFRQYTHHIRPGRLHGQC